MVAGIEFFSHMVTGVSDSALFLRLECCLLKFLFIPARRKWEGCYILVYNGLLRNIVLVFCLQFEVFESIQYFVGFFGIFS